MGIEQPISESDSTADRFRKQAELEKKDAEARQVLARERIQGADIPTPELENEEEDTRDEQIAA